MPSSWTPKRERQYEKIKKSVKERGASLNRAKEVAARTVNKQRRQAGETSNKRTSGTGNPNSALQDLGRDELYNRAKELGISGRSRMSKRDLIQAIQRAR